MLKKFLTTTAVLATMLTLGTGMATAQDLGWMSWDQIETQARKEGQLTWYVWYYQDAFRQAVKGFEDAYGIKVTIPEGTADANSQKMLSDASREVGDIDVFAWGWTEFAKLDDAKYFYNLSMLPKDAGRKTAIGGLDGEGYVLPYWGNQTGIAYDPARIEAADLPQTADDFAKFWQENPGKFGFNYENGGAGPSFFENVLRVLDPEVDFSDGAVTDEKVRGLQAGFDLFNAHADDYVITTSNADNIVRVSDGELMLAPVWEDQLASMQKSGEARRDIKLYIPKMGMQGGGNGIAIPVNAPHPAAAALFAAWLTSADTQTLFNQNFGTAPMNANSDDSKALIPNDQRAYSVEATAQPFKDAVKEAFVDNVILNR